MKRLAIALVSATVVAGCAGTSKESKGLKRVDDLVGHVERVHVQAELAKQSVASALQTLFTITAPDFDGDPVVAYTEFVEAIENSEDRAEELDEAVEPMKQVATKVFEQWYRDLDAFTSPQMRQRSQARMHATRQRYDAIVQAVDPAQQALETFNLGLRDHATFLNHDFNPAAVSEIEREVRAIGDWSGKLDRKLELVLVAAQDYVQASALPGPVEMSRVEDEPVDFE